MFFPKRLSGSRAETLRILSSALNCQLKAFLEHDLVHTKDLSVCETGGHTGLVQNALVALVASRDCTAGVVGRADQIAGQRIHTRGNAGNGGVVEFKPLKVTDCLTATV